MLLNVLSKYILLLIIVIIITIIIPDRGRSEWVLDCPALSGPGAQLVVCVQPEFRVVSSCLSTAEIL